MVNVENTTAFNSCGIPLLIIKMTFQARVLETVYIFLYYHEYQHLCVCVHMCVHLHMCLQQAVSEFA